MARGRKWACTLQGVDTQCKHNGHASDCSGLTYWGIMSTVCQCVRTPCCIHSFFPSHFGPAWALNSTDLFPSLSAERVLMHWNSTELVTLSVKIIYRNNTAMIWPTPSYCYPEGALTWGCHSNPPDRGHSAGRACCACKNTPLSLHGTPPWPGHRGRCSHRAGSLSRQTEHTVNSKDLLQLHIFFSPHLFVSFVCQSPLTGKGGTPCCANALYQREQERKGISESAHCYSEDDCGHYCPTQAALILPRQGQWMRCASVWTVRCMQVISFLLLFLVSMKLSDWQADRDQDKQGQTVSDKETYRHIQADRDQHKQGQTVTDKETYRHIQADRDQDKQGQTVTDKETYRHIQADRDQDKLGQTERQGDIQAETKQTGTDSQRDTFKEKHLWLKQRDKTDRNRQTQITKTKKQNGQGLADSNN